MIDKKRFIRTGHLWGLQVGGQEMPPVENLLVYSFIIKGEVGKGRRTSLSFLSRCQVFIITPSPGWAGEFSCLCGWGWVHKLLFFYVCRKHVLGVTNLLSSLGRMPSLPLLFNWLGACPVILLHDFFAKQACLVLWLSKPDFSSNH